MEILGIDVGGSGIKGAIVDTQTGLLVSERKRLNTPQPATPDAIANTIKELVDSFNYEGPIGASFPTIIRKGKALSFGNIDQSWLGVQVDELFYKKTGHRYTVNNDADLAGMAEMKLGAGVGEQGKVIMVTIGTGLGSGVFYDGVLIPNIELGRILGKDGKPIEYYAGDKARKENGLKWKQWGDRFNFFLNHVVRISSPDLFILGGGASKKFEKFKNQITIHTPIKIAKFGNNAGILGAALSAVE